MRPAGTRFRGHVRCLSADLRRAGEPDDGTRVCGSGMWSQAPAPHLLQNRFSLYVVPSLSHESLRERKHVSQGTEACHFVFISSSQVVRLHHTY